MTIRTTTLSLLTLLILFPTMAAANDEPPADGDTWLDHRHKGVSKRLDKWSNRIDDWFGEPNPDHPADANLRLMLDTEWNPDDKFTVTPRVRGRLKLPTLEKKVHVVFGDDSLDDELKHEANAYRNRTNTNGRIFDASQSRDKNASIAVRWSEAFVKQRIDTDFDIGIRSGSDLFARAKSSSNWQLTDNIDTSLEQIYRYGIKSKHHVRTNWETRYIPNEKSFIANQAHLQYEHDKTEDWTWGNSLFRQHNLGKHRHVNYGVYTGGNIEKRKASLNTYGPFTTYRQPIWRNWLFTQTEVNYYNNRKENQKHRVGALLRIEALF